ncbi:hypothetical protein J3R30DRAFT_3402485 [Lentinula aciculospora]|uniref:Uncharacterized protein n=1 Tax=Lentinula aciculospora TaxID=153920 RepID=A0A9W9DS41_9AGAR|nr:hypothetical protein J3R30DRAFT_3402485 [Lentinula aciculospora]
MSNLHPRSEGFFSTGGFGISPLFCDSPFEMPGLPDLSDTDITGQTFLASFHYDDRTLFPGVLKRGVVGSTICVMYAYFHRFVDGQTGVRLEEPKDVKILPLGIEELVAQGVWLRGPSRRDGCAFYLN